MYDGFDSVLHFLPTRTMSVDDIGIIDLVHDSVTDPNLNLFKLFVVMGPLRATREIR